MGDRGYSCGKRLFRAQDEQTLPFLGTPQAALGVGRLTFFGLKKVNPANPEARALEEKLSRCLGPWKTDDPSYGQERRGRLTVRGATASDATTVIAGRSAAATMIRRSGSMVGSAGGCS